MRWSMNLSVLHFKVTEKSLPDDHADALSRLLSMREIAVPFDFDIRTCLLRFAPASSELDVVVEVDDLHVTANTIALSLVPTTSEERIGVELHRFLSH